MEINMIDLWLLSQQHSTTPCDFAWPTFAPDLYHIDLFKIATERIVSTDINNNNNDVDEEL